MHNMEESPASLEIIVRQLLDYFLQQPTAQTALNATISALQNIKAEYSSDYSSSFYSFVAVPFNYLSGNTQVVQNIDGLNLDLQKIASETSWTKQHGYAVLDRLFSFINNKDWGADSVNIKFISALIKLGVASKDYPAKDSDLKQMLADKDGNSFIRELKVALDKERAKDRLPQTQKPIEDQLTSPKTTLRELSIDTATIEEEDESSNEEGSKNEEQTAPKEEIFFSGDGTMLTYHRKQKTSFRLPNPIRGFVDFFADDSAYYPAEKPTVATSVIDDSEPWGTVKTSNMPLPGSKLQYSPITGRQGRGGPIMDV